MDDAPADVSADAGIQSSEDERKGRRRSVSAERRRKALERRRKPSSEGTDED